MHFHTNRVQRHVSKSDSPSCKAMRMLPFKPLCTAFCETTENYNHAPKIFKYTLIAVMMGI